MISVPSALAGTASKRDHRQAAVRLWPGTISEKVLRWFDEYMDVGRVLSQEIQ